MVTDLIGTAWTVTQVVSALPSQVRETLRGPPGDSAMTSPASTRAIAGCDEPHVHARPTATFPSSSITLAVSRALCAGNSVTSRGVSSTRATGTGFTMI